MLDVYAFSDFVYITMTGLQLCSTTFNECRLVDYVHNVLVVKQTCSLLSLPTGPSKQYTYCIVEGNDVAVLTCCSAPCCCMPVRASYDLRVSSQPQYMFAGVPSCSSFSVVTRNNNPQRIGF